MGATPPGSAGNHPTSNCIQDQEALSAHFLRMWLQGIPTDQFDPGLNKEKCVWIRTHVVSFVPSLPEKSPCPQKDLRLPWLLCGLATTCGLLEWEAWTLAQWAWGS